MNRFLAPALATILVSGLSHPTRADDLLPNAILDKAIKALGGEEKLKKAEAITWKAKGTITFNDNDNDIKVQSTFQGLDHHRREVEGEFGGEPRKFIVVLSGD